MDAFRPQVERYQRVLFSVAARMLGDEDEATDVAQNAFVRGDQKLGTYDRTHKFFSWLYRILVNECLNVRRARRIQVPLGASLAAPDDTHRAAEQAEIRAVVQSALLRLPVANREVVVRPVCGTARGTPCAVGSGGSSSAGARQKHGAEIGSGIGSTRRIHADV